MNKAILMGNIASDIELRQTQNGTMTARFRIACRRSQDETDFITCTAFGKTAELISKHFAKGLRILVEGNIKTGSYDDKAGNKVYTTEIWVSAIDFPEKARNTSPAPQAQPQNAQRPPAQPAYNQQGYQQQGYQNFPQDYDYGDLPY